MLSMCLKYMYFKILNITNNLLVFISVYCIV